MLSLETLDFLRELKDNNNKEWFTRNKGRFQQAQQDFLGFIDELIEKLTLFDPAISGVAAKDTIFRIYRDTRFSKDKSPYKTNLGAHINAGGRKASGSGYYVHVEPGANFLGGGIYCPDPKSLQSIRQNIAQDSAPLRKIIRTAKFQNHFQKIYGEQVKTAPRGFSQDHPDIDLLRYKSFAVLKSVTDQELLSKDFMKICVDTFKIMQPFNQCLDSYLHN